MRATVLVALLLVGACQSSKPEEQPEERSSASTPKGPALDYVIARPQALDEVIQTDGELLAWQRIRLQSEVAGRVVGLSMPEGGRVERGQVLLRMDSRELRAQRDRMQAELRLARNKLQRQKTLQANDLASAETVEELQRDVETSEAEVQRLQAAIDKTILRAPFSGRLGLHDVVVGAYLSPQENMTDLVDDRRLKLDFALAEQYTGQVTTGDTVFFTTNVNPDSAQPAKVYAVSPQVATDSRRLQVRAEVPNPQGRWKPGLFAEIELPIKRRSRAIMIPNIALIPTRDRKEVFIYKHGQAHSRALVTGFRSENRVEVIQGLQRGDTVLTSGLLQIQDGQAVQVREEPES